MHMVIRAIVYSEDDKNALAQAKDIFETLVEHEHFDYYVTFDMDGHKVSGKDRWGNLPIVARTDSEEGNELIEKGMKNTKEEFLSNMGKIRTQLKDKTDEQLFEESSVLFRAYLSWTGALAGSSTFLYDHEGMGINDPEHLDNALNKWKTHYEDKGELSPYKDLDIYVVPADVHF